MSARSIIAAVIACIFFASVPAAAQLSAGDWPKYKHDSSNSGRYPATAIAKPELKWETSLSDSGYTAGRGTWAGPTIDSEGNIYIVDSGPTGAVTKISSAGAILWRSAQTMGGGTQCGATLWTGAGDPYVIVGPGYASPGLYGLDPASGAAIWSVSNDPNGNPFWGSDGTPAVGPDGTIYVHQRHANDYDERGKIIAIDPTNVQAKWEYYFADDPQYYGLVGIGWNYGTPVVTTDASGKNVVIIAGSESGWGGGQGIPNVYAIRDDGATCSLVWGVISGYHQANPVLSNDGTTVYEASTHWWGTDNFKALNVADGTTKWSLDYPLDNQESTPVIGADGTIYAANGSGRLAAIQDNGAAGAIKWTLDLPGGGSCTTPALISGTSKPVIYVGTSAGTFFAVRDDGTTGTILWTYRRTADAPSTPAVASDGTVIVPWGSSVIAFAPGFAGSVPQAKISGYVKDAAGNPIANALVGVAMHSNPLPDNDFAYLTTDATGRFQIGSLDTGTYYLAAWARGYRATADTTVVLDSPVDVKTASFTLSEDSVNKAIGMAISTNNPDPDAGFAPIYANDGNFNTRFASNNSSPDASVDNLPTQLLLDAGANCSASEMLIYWESAYAKVYKIQALPDGYNPDVASTDWETYGTTLYSTGTGRPYGNVPGLNWWTGVDVIPFANTNARYWRIYATKATAWCMSVYELELHDSSRAVKGLGELKSLADGTQVGFADKMVTASAGAGIPVNVIYAEDMDRSSGIRVDVSSASGTKDVVYGDLVDIIGTVQTNANGEKYIAASTVGQRSGTPRPPDALGMNNRAAGMSIAQGLLVKLWGKASSIQTDSFTITDGSGTPIKVYCGSLNKPTDGQDVRVRGIISTESGAPVLLMRNKQVDWTSADSQIQPLPLAGKAEAFRDYLVLGLYTDTFGGGDVGRDARLAFDFLSDSTSGTLTEANVAPSLGDSVGDKKWVRYKGDSDFAMFDYLYGQTADSVTYAMVYVWSETDQWVDLSLGSDDGVKVWVNGNMVWTNGTWRGLGYDQDVVNVPINAGINRILFKVANGTGGYGVVARLAQSGTGGTGTFVPAPGIGYLLSK